jgi:hypothetical protein
MRVVKQALGFTYEAQIFNSSLNVMFGLTLTSLKDLFIQSAIKYSLEF